ncbi:MAG: hypothetical protein AAGD86_13230, partial [Pseudomonadota bacterium]
FEDDALSATIDTVRRERIGVVHLVRDPRDVLVSRHAGAGKPADFYVEPERWASSVAAGDALLSAVAHRAPTVTVRYEDVVVDPAYAERLLVSAFGLKKRAGVQSIDRLADNVRELGVSVAMETALHKLRNFDRTSVQKWRADPGSSRHVLGLLDEDSAIAVRLHDFLWRHRYLPGAWSAQARRQGYARAEPPGDATAPPTEH